MRRSFTVSDNKPSVAQEQIVALLHEQFSSPVIDLISVTGGQIAQTLAFTVDGRDYIIRFTHHMGANLEKEAYLSERIASGHIPIPTIVKVGRLGELHYAISHRVPGQPMNMLPRQEYAQLLPVLIETLDAIHHVDVRDLLNYGTFDDNGVGLFPSWRRYLEQIREEEEPWDFYGKWHVLFEQTFLERELFEQIYTKMVHLLDACPEERFLVHGNYGFGNVMVHEGRITGVLDWLDAKYGDFVFDLAWLDLWSPEGRFAERFQHYYATRGTRVEHYTERLRCYQCYIGLDGLRFFAKMQNHDAYRWIRQRILSLLQS
jgi:hygromycin-B 4-O-kinase